MSKKTIIRKKKILISVAALVLAFIIGSLWYIYFYMFRWSVEASYDEYSKEFNTVAEFILGKYSSKDDMLFYVNSEKLVDVTINEEVEQPEDVQRALKILSHEAFKHTEDSLGMIRVSGNEVMFQIEGGYYGIVYSPDKEPEKVGFLEDEEYYIKEADENWYHVRVK